MRLDHSAHTVPRFKRGQLVEAIANRQELPSRRPADTYPTWATPTERERLIASLVLAFNHDPVARWMYPDPHQYLRYFGDFIREFGGLSFKLTTAYRINGFSGGSLWFPPGAKGDETRLVDLLKSTVFEEQQPDLFAVFEQMEAIHPQEPHWYLAVLGVEPTQQNRGYGSVLIAPVLERCDLDGLPAYLESSNPANLSFYRRHGFETIGKIQAGDCPPLFPMIRYPKTR